MLVEDDPAIRRLVTFLLENEGFGVVAHEDAATNVDIWAPGVDMAMPTGYGDYEYKYEPGGWGTSFSAPLVSGAIAVAVQKGRCSNANTALDQLLQWSNSMTCGPALDAIWAGLGN